MSMITDLPTKRIQALSQRQTFLGVFTYKMAAKMSTGTDVDQHYVTVTLCTMYTLKISAAYANCCSTSARQYCDEFHVLRTHRCGCRCRRERAISETCSTETWTAFSFCPHHPSAQITSTENIVAHMGCSQKDLRV